jgi:predicted secreted protein
MRMATYEGSNGAVKMVDGAGSLTAVAEVQSWNVSTTRDTVEDTVMGDGYRTYKKGLQTWSGSMTIVYSDTSGAEVTTALNPDTDTVIGVELFPDTSVTGTKFAGNIVVTSFAVTASFDGLITATVDFQGTGAPTTWKYGNA